MKNPAFDTYPPHFKMGITHYQPIFNIASLIVNQSFIRPPLLDFLKEFEQHPIITFRSI